MSGPVPEAADAASWVVGVAVGLALLVAAAPWGRASPGARRGVESPGAGVPTRVARDLAATLHAVAAQLRAGADPVVAWTHVLGVRPDGATGLEDALRACVEGAADRRTGPRAGSRGRRGLVLAPARAVRGAAALVPARGTAGRGSRRRGGGRGTAEAARVRAAVAAVVVADELGASLAPVLERIARSVALDEEAAADLHAALAGPRATARLLAWLPAFGVVLGLAIGADPLRVLLGGGLGTGAGAAGVGLTLVGRAWTSRLVRAAAAGGDG